MSRSPPFRDHKRSDSVAKESRERIRVKKNGSLSITSQEKTMEELAGDPSFSRNKSPNDFLLLEKSQQQNPTPLTDTIVFAEEESNESPTHRTNDFPHSSPRRSKIQVEDIDIEKSERNSEEGISLTPLGVKPVGNARK